MINNLGDLLQHHHRVSTVNLSNLRYNQIPAMLMTFPSTSAVDYTPMAAISL